MDIQVVMDKISEGWMYKRVATGQNMGLGSLIEALKGVPDQNMPVVVGGVQTLLANLASQESPETVRTLLSEVGDLVSNVPKSLASYRGYYSDLSIQCSDWNRKDENWLDSVGKLREALEAAVGKTFQGYKGGDFVMALHTPMWSAPYGETGEAIHGVEVRDGVLVLITVADTMEY